MKGICVHTIVANIFQCTSNEVISVFFDNQPVFSRNYGGLHKLFKNQFETLALRSYALPNLSHFKESFSLLYET